MSYSGSSDVCATMIGVHRRGALMRPGKNSQLDGSLHTPFFLTYSIQINSKVRQCYPWHHCLVSLSRMDSAQAIHCWCEWRKARIFYAQRRHNLYLVDRIIMVIWLVNLSGKCECRVRNGEATKIEILHSIYLSISLAYEFMRLYLSIILSLSVFWIIL